MGPGPDSHHISKEYATHTIKMNCISESAKRIYIDLKINQHVCKCVAHTFKAYVKGYMYESRPSEGSPKDSSLYMYYYMIL